MRLPPERGALAGGWSALHVCETRTGAPGPPRPPLCALPRAGPRARPPLPGAPAPSRPRGRLMSSAQNFPLPGRAGLGALSHRRPRPRPGARGVCRCAVLSPPAWLDVIALAIPLDPRGRGRTFPPGCGVRLGPVERAHLQIPAPRGRRPEQGAGPGGERRVPAPPH